MQGNYNDNPMSHNFLENRFFQLYTNFDLRGFRVKDMSVKQENFARVNAMQKWSNLSYDQKDMIIGFSANSRSIFEAENFTNCMRSDVVNVYRA